jgi:hypothetical protein
MCDLSTPRDFHHDICAPKSQSWQHHDVGLHGLCGQMPLSTMEDCHCGQRSIGHRALYVHQLYRILSVDHLLYWSGSTHVQLHAASYFAESGCIYFFEWGSRAIFSVAAIDASRCTNWCLRCSSVSARGAVYEELVVWLNSDWITPGWGVCRAMTWYCG